mgnify:FL=1
MNEQIRNILAQDATKTSKIRQLLLLGMTRRKIADLLTNGNYGFVHNVYKKMLQDGLIENIWNSAIETRQPVRPDYTFTHKFGIEIEAYNCSMSRLADELREAGIRVTVEGYNLSLIHI